jgi:hypothetical protein
VARGKKGQNKEIEKSEKENLQKQETVTFFAERKRFFGELDISKKGK